MAGQLDKGYRDAGIVKIRPAVMADMPAIAAIYDEAVRTGTGSFEVDPPGVENMARRQNALLVAGFPCLVAERAVLEGGGHGGKMEILGYAYASSLRPRAAFGFTVEDSIYVNAPARGMGVGRQLLEALVEACTARGFRQMVALIGDSANLGSIALHRACGFQHQGVLPACGFKFGRWLDVVLMQRPLGEGAQTLPPE
ncbi:GNAT family N-acetyltransferase [Xanthobacter sp. TB0139]|uniref:GNAT family N-acetyltransferase n=1 Tax=Xanthobacter sp. TB0139 TaxID=3459178 RepID=UPI004039E6CF